MDSCKGCHFLHSMKDPQNIGQTQQMCKRFPPTPVAIPTPVAPSLMNPQGGVHVQIMAVYPPVQLGCGEYTPAAPSLAS